MQNGPEEGEVALLKESAPEFQEEATPETKPAKGEVEGQGRDNLLRLTDLATAW